MEELKRLGLKMEKEMKDSLVYDEKSGFWYDKEDQESTYTEEGIRLSVYEDLKDTLNSLYSECAYWVACSTEKRYNYCMDHLKEYVKEWIEFHKSEFDCSDQTEEETFEIVMENVVSMVEDYSFYDYNKEDK